MRALIDGKGWEFLRLRIVSLMQNVTVGEPRNVLLLHCWSIPSVTLFMISHLDARDNNDDVYAYMTLVTNARVAYALSHKAL